MSLDSISQMTKNISSLSLSAQLCEHLQSMPIMACLLTSNMIKEGSENELCTCRWTAGILSKVFLQMAELNMTNTVLSHLKSSKDRVSAPST